MQFLKILPFHGHFRFHPSKSFLIFDKTRRESFTNIKRWIEDIDRRNPQGIPKILIGNKRDLTFDIEVTDEEIKDYCKSNKLEYIETSAKTGENIDLAFIYIALQSISG